MNSNEHRATGRVLDILELLSAKTEGLSLTEIATALNAPKSSLLPILHTMCERNFLRLSAQDSNRYKISYQTYMVGSAYSSNKTTITFLRQRMQRIVDEMKEIAQLAILSGDSVYYLIRVETDNPITLRSQETRMLPAYCTGLGKALLSGLTEEEVRALYPYGLTAHTPRTISTFERLEEQLREVRRTGYSYEHAELVEGVECVATPLHSHDNVVAAISFTMPDYRINEERRECARRLLASFRSEVEPYFAKLNIERGTDLL